MKELPTNPRAAAGRGCDFLDEVSDAFRVVLDGEGGFEDVSVTVADECDVFALGVVKDDAEDLVGVAAALEDSADEDVLVLIDGLDLAGCFHGTVKGPC